jgi:hypothetical protein
MNSRNTKGNTQFRGRIDRKTHNISDLKSAYSKWDEMNDEEKLQATRNVEPVDKDTVYNVTTDKLHQYFVRNLDPQDTDSDANLEVGWLGLGTGAGNGTSTTDTDLNTRTYEETVTDVANNGKDLLASTFIDSTDGNGNDFDELGLFTGNPNNATGNSDIFMMNHATFATVTKDNSKTVTFDVTLTFSDT